ncbi:DUF4843 domain-containing protein [Pinibacter soli]|uniref:DUF4843 domain-containing protein n=1 Tax=Pinibacter soli TaxID=3044211 RepID=A0ABT6RD15_9BACT|nr:DUF4843 domain-containing protein [Pinibacter soli]MDI3320286.1 DUF4843 domain-containing protein [Pinibacter soli]
MKALIYIAGAFIAGMSLLTACKKSSIDSYQQDARVYFRIPGEFDSKQSRDSLIYSFPFHPNVTTQDTLWFEANIMGNATSTDREIGINVITDSSNAVENVDFKIGSKIMPAGAFKINIPIVIYKKAVVKDSVLRLQLAVTENSDFKLGYTGKTKAIFLWGYKFLRPDNWEPSTTDASKPNYAAAFGSPFSQVRTKFILDSCHITNLPDPSNRIIMENYNSTIRSALNNYNRGKTFTLQLKDENGVNIFFPTFGGPGLG